MQMRKINEHQVRCVLNNADLASHKITVREIRYGDSETKELFEEVVFNASKKFNFNKENLPLMIEAIPMNKEEVLLILTAVEEPDEMDPHFANYANEPEGDSGNGNANARRPSVEVQMESEQCHHAVVAFPNIEAVCQLANATRMEFKEEYLYRNGNNKGFLLLLTEKENAHEEFISFMNLVNEYGFAIPSRDEGKIYGALKEHELPVLENPLSVLRRKK